MNRIGPAVLIVLLLVVGHIQTASARTRCTTNQQCVEQFGSLTGCGVDGFCASINGQPCGENSECVTGLCQIPPGVCAGLKRAPAVSTCTMLVMAAALLLLGMWSARRVARRR